MANVKISQLPVAGPLTGVELIPIVQSGVTDQSNTLAIFDYVAGTFVFGSGLNYDVPTKTLTVDADLQLIYDNGLSGLITLDASKPAGYISTVAGFLVPSMTTLEFQAIALPDNGLLGWSSDQDRFITNKGSNLSPVYDVLAYLSDITAVTNNSAYGEMNFSGNTTETVISSTVTPVKIAGTYLSGSLQGFGQSSGTLTRSVVDTDNVFNLNISLTASPVSSACNLSFIAMVNGSSGTTANLLQSVDFDSTIPSQQSISISGSVTMANGDTLQIFVRNNTAVQNVLVSNFNCFVTSIGGVNEGSTATLQEAYNAGDGTITTIAGKPFELISTTSGFRMQSMTSAQFGAITLPDNGLMSWSNDSNRVLVNTGTPGSPDIKQIAYTSDTTIDTLQEVYDNSSTGIINLGVGKPFGFSSTNAGFLLPPMTTGQFAAIATPANGLTAWDTTQNRITVNKGTSGSPVVDSVAYLTDIGGTATLESAYTAGDGTMTATFNKPLELNSNDNSIGPVFQLRQLQVPISNQVLTTQNSIANNVTYDSYTVTAETVPGNSISIRRARSSGGNVIVHQYTGSTNTFDFISNANFSANAHSTSTITVGSNTQGVNSTVATVITPTTSYPGNVVGTYSMWVALSGTPQIPVTFAIGDTIEIDVVGNLEIVTPDAVVVGNSYFEINVSGLFDIASNNINPSTYPSSFNGVFEFRLKITRIATSQINVTGCGWRENTDGTMKVITFPSSTYLYGSGVPYSIQVNFHKGSTGGSSSVYAYIANGLNIKQYS